MIIMIPLIFKPNYFVFTMIFLSLALLVHYFTKQEVLRKYLDGKYHVKKVTRMGPIVSDNKTNIFLRSKDHFRNHDLIYVKGYVNKIVNSKT